MREKNLRIPEKQALEESMMRTVKKVPATVCLENLVTKNLKK